MIILCGGEKGGAAKTTIATNFASILAGMSRDVLLVDTDPQGSASDWASTRATQENVVRVGAIQKFGKGLLAEVQDLASRYDDVILDAGGRDSAELRASLAVADVAVLPFQPSHFDLWTVNRAAELIETARGFNQNLVVIAVISRASTHAVANDTAEAKELLQDYQSMILANSVLRDRVAFRRAAGMGLGVVESKLDEKASLEMQHLFDQVWSYHGK